jgi:glycosyltransferase involved in cell wall biosynthesis
MSQKAPKVVFLITKSNFGGAQKYVYELALETKRHDVDVSVACGGTGDKEAKLGLLATKLQSAGITVHPIAHFMRDMSAKNDLLAFFEIYKLLHRERPDVLHVTSSKAGGVGALAGRLLGVPRIIFTSHGLTVDETWRPRWQRVLIYLATWGTLALCHASIMISKETYHRARTMPGMKDKVHFIKNGVTPIDFLTKDEAQKALHLTIPTGHTVIGGIGELHPNKNWEAAINMVATLPPTTHLAIIGEGEEFARLRHQIDALKMTDRIHLLGYVVDAAKYLKAFDIFILPSKKEGLPYVLLEAGLASLPVIASDLPGNRDIINSGEEGFLIAPEPTLLATSTQMLLRDEGMRRRLGAALEQKVTQEFSIKTMTNKTFTLYSKSPLAS